MFFEDICEFECLLCAEGAQGAYKSIRITILYVA